MATSETPMATESNWWKGKLAPWWGMVRLGHEGMMLEKIQRQNNEVIELARMTREGTLGESTAQSQTKGGEGVGVNIGNEIHNHYESTVPLTNPAEAVKDGLGVLGKAAIAAGLLGSGGGIGAIVANFLTAPPAAVDTDTYKDFRLEPGEVTEIEP